MSVHRRANAPDTKFEELTNLQNWLSHLQHLQPDKKQTSKLLPPPQVVPGMHAKGVFLALTGVDWQHRPKRGGEWVVQELTGVDIAD